jgi:hypothetical protein
LTVIDTRRTALIAIDWGTTSARAYRVGASGEVIAVRSAPLGVLNVRDHGFADALDTLLDDWRDDAVPRIACGMIGSRQGWIEAPYIACPADLAGLGGALTRTQGGELAIVPGARCVDVVQCDPSRGLQPAAVLAAVVGQPIVERTSDDRFEAPLAADLQTFWAGLLVRLSPATEINSQPRP